MSELPIEIKSTAGRRLRQGHLWVYANELVTPPGRLGLAAGAQVSLSCAGKSVGRGYFNPNSLIAVRVLDRQIDAVLDEDWLERRMQQALDLRQGLADPTHARLVHGEADGLPGLILDRFDQLLVAQSGTAGMDAMRPALEAILRRRFPRSTLLWRNIGPARRAEGLQETVEVAWGELAELHPVVEHGYRFWFSPRAGQKTGWFYDQRDNRQRVAALAAGRRVLDVFSYLGGFAVSCAVAGASEVVAVDGSAEALTLLQRNAQANEVDSIISARHGDAFEQLVALHAAGERFGLVIIDPPAFVKRRKDFPQGNIAYRRLAAIALRLVEPGGYIASFSCSHHYPREALLDALAHAAASHRCHLGIVAQLHAAPDHPVHPAMPESEYLKGFIGRVGGTV
ncbi:MAG: class I SAM-dependent rRNA methyltransferase [Xanthomonadales bacterium]|nr:class I SAM-dependent rRNA methyltransferase [Xanthomonadales bacterium]